MAYSTSNPPVLVTQTLANSAAGNKTWVYTSADTAATVDTSGYITNGGALGMKVGDLVIVNDTTSPLTTEHRVITVSSTYPGAVDLGNGTTIGLATNTD